MTIDGGMRMTVYKQKMKVNDIDVIFISFLAMIAFLTGWFLFGPFIAVLLALLVAVVGIIRMKRTRSVDRLNAKKGLYQETLFKK